MGAQIYSFCLSFFIFFHLCATDGIEGPCRKWYRSCKSHEEKNQWECTSVEEYVYYTIKGCPHGSQVKTPPPPAGRCIMVDNVCQFDTSSTLQCAFHHMPSDFCQYKCLAVNGSNPTDNCNYNRYLPPDTLCIPINGQCQEYSPCKYWESSSSPSFKCGTVDDYYRFKFGPLSSRSSEHGSPVPPGECILQNNSCSWSKCLQHMDLCQFYWMCGSTYDAAMYYALPPHTCPVPPPGTTPPPPPGKCVFSMEASKCKFTGKENEAEEKESEYTRRT